LITVNDYLAQRDADDMSRIYEFLGLTTGVILSEMEPDQRKAAYACDITYGTNNEFGFDYLRDNMAFELEGQVQRDLNFAVVDEVDSILIDEARTPLVISGGAEDSSEHYVALNKLIPKLTKREEKEGPGDYYLDEKTKQAFLTEDGHEHLENLLTEAKMIKKGESLYSPQNVNLMHFANAVLRAHTLYQLDVDYMIKDNEVMIVDEHTGRAMPGRRWSDGLHQAVEAREGLKIQDENQTMASITFQNYFKLYTRLSGMTGTADTEAFEFHQTYGLEVVITPTNKPVVRKDYPDLIYQTFQEKFEAMAVLIGECVVRKQPVLVGTTSIETSEFLSKMLTKQQVKHEVLNAKQHEREAGIVAEAGLPGSVTIATNMAGRGTDIVLGGNWQVEVAALEKPTQKQIDKIKADWQKRHNEVLTAGGLYIVGSERHESRRIDNQLRGRSGRQGDPGASRFYLSMEDNLVRIFAGERLAGLLEKLGLRDGEAIESKMVSRSIANAQKKVENYYFDQRKQLLEYDNVANEQRKVIYTQRQELLEAEHLDHMIETIREDVVGQLVNLHIPPETLEEQWDVEGLAKSVNGDFALNLALQKWLDEDETVDENTLADRILQAMTDNINQKCADVDPEALRQFNKMTLMQSLDTHWRDHLSAMDHLRNSIHLRGYAQKDPKQEYKRESFNLFSEMLDNFRYDVISTLSKVEIQAESDVAQAQTQWKNGWGAMTFEHAILDDNAAEAEVAEVEAQQPMPEVSHKVGRNDLCPCGSSKKYKQCHGKLV
jgi:preprotein translocase subunit SecA